MGHLYHGYVSHNQSETIFFMGFPSWPRTIAWRICGSRHRTQPPWPKNPPLPWCCCWHPVIARRRCGRRWCRWSHWGVRVGGWLGYVKETSCVNRWGNLKHPLCIHCCTLRYFWLEHVPEGIKIGYVITAWINDFKTTPFKRLPVYSRWGVILWCHGLSK